MPFINLKIYKIHKMKKKEILVAKKKGLPLVHVLIVPVT